MKDDIKQLLKQEKEKAALEAEIVRYRSMCAFEEAAYADGVKIIGGIDEAGRGPLAGPVVAACVILPGDAFIKGLNDSKKLTPAKRDLLYDEILEKAIALSTGIVDEKCIDEINILNATKKAMKSAIDTIKPVPELLLIDAVKLSEVPVRQIPIIKGDALSVSIAAVTCHQIWP